ncbi:MAG: 50S ribosomal protein L17 [Christensenellaceae bacterium]|jgi:large subunit ribosomal protein L17|nr:50S ribosomal protein L17 [Christensenellaceae bacterium]
MKNQGHAKLGLRTDQRLQIIRNQVSQLLWNGRIETTLAYAKATATATEKVLTIAIDAYTDTVKVDKDVINSKGVTVKKTVLQDGPKKLAARRKIMSKTYDLFETRSKEESKASFDKRTKHINHPLVEKIFNELAPKYAKRAKEVGQGGGYTRVLKLGFRRGDDAERAIVELV